MQISGLERFSVILASKSPRRQQLLGELGIEFTVREIDFDESYPGELEGKEIATWLAQQKASVFRNSIGGNELVITADTVVWCRGKVLGKPGNRQQAIEMIKEMSDTTHEVITGVTLLTAQKERTFCVTTEVTFDKLSDGEINYYVDRYQPYDKAGAYGIQEWIGLAACSKINGSYFNVVGLPVHRLYNELKLFVSE